MKLQDYLNMGFREMDKWPIPKDCCTDGCEGSIYVWNDDPGNPNASCRQLLDKSFLNSFVSDALDNVLREKEKEEQKGRQIIDNFGGIIINKEDNTMINANMFNGIFGRIEPGMCRISMSGKIAIKTSNGYKSFDPKTGRLTNCDNFAFNIGEDFFFVIPTNKVEPGDIILANGKPRCVLEVGKNEIKTFCYEDSSISTIVPEHHMFMGKNYFYGKIISMFGEVGNGSKSTRQIMKFMMMKEMMGNSNTNNRDGGLSSLMPMMMLTSGFGGGNFFDGMFDFDEGEEEEDPETEKIEEKASDPVPRKRAK